MARLFTNRLFFSLSSAFIAGCALTVVGERPADAPPKIIEIDDRREFGRRLLTWDRPSAFGQVPSSLKALGDAACLTERVDLEAIGYHPNALDRHGNPIPGGGFYCAIKLNRDRFDLWPPSLIKTGESLAWDRPKAFGAVPSELQQRGDQTCGQLSPDLRAIGYHPWARNVEGEPISGGGFFCAQHQR